MSDGGLEFQSGQNDTTFYFTCSHLKPAMYADPRRHSDFETDLKILHALHNIISPPLRDYRNHSRIYLFPSLFFVTSCPTQDTNPWEVVYNLQ